MKSYSSLNKSKDYANSEYEILALMEDFKELEPEDFQTNQNTLECPPRWLNPDGIISRVMEANEIREFHKIKDEYFKEVFSDPKTGNIYELKNNSFKKQYKNIINT
ncbi:MAG TPA: hypothetical protein DEB71_06355 [Chryseobacterium carnipullorum]|nr:hypothetical protein [Chryseobacterium carnipullorum]